MLILIPGNNPLPSYIVAKIFDHHTCVVVTENKDYACTERLRRRLYNEGRETKSLIASPPHVEKFVLDLTKNEAGPPIIQFTDSPLSACIVQAIKHKEPILIGKDLDEMIAIAFCTTRRMRAPQISLEALLDLQGIKGKLEQDVLNPQLSATFASELNSESKMVEFLRWTYGKAPLPLSLGTPLPENSEWLRGGWLREHLFSILKKKFNECTVHHSIRFSDREIAIDVALIQGHRLFAFATCTYNHYTECLARALSVRTAAKRLAGDFSYTTLVCACGWPQAKTLEKRLANIVGRYEIAVLGIDSIPNLENALTIAPPILSDVEKVREKEYEKSLLLQREDD